jgi:hypothetical protein
MKLRYVLVSTVIFFLSAVILFPVHLFAQTDSENNDNRLLSLIKHEPFSVSGLIQVFGRYSFEDTNFNGGRTFQAGNARIGISGVLDEQFDYQFQFNFAREPNLLDAYMSYNHSERFRIRMGAQKPQFSAELLPHPGLTDLISRARLVGTMLNPRELGASIFGDLGQVRYYFGLFNGNGVNTNTDNKFFYMGRLAYQEELDNGRFVRVGINGAFGDNDNTTIGSSGIQVAGHRYLYGGDIRFEDNQWIFAAEMLVGDFDVTNYIGGPEETIVGYYFTGGYKINERTRVVARWDHLSFREIDSGSDQFILGLTHYVTDLVSFRINLLSEFDEAIDNQVGVSASMQLHF